MSTCYKCNAELPGMETECSPECPSGSDCQPQFRPILTAEEIEDQAESYERHSVAVDWDKVQTFEDLKLITRVLVMVDTVPRGTEMYRLLRKFLKEKNPHD